MPSYSYLAFAYRQSPTPGSPYLLSLVAPADEIESWAGVPRRERSGGFQRLEDNRRVTRIADFFRDPSNQSPTAIVIGVSESPVVEGSVDIQALIPLDDFRGSNIEELASPATGPEPTSSESSEMSNQVKVRGGAPLLCRVTFDTPDEYDIEDLARRYRDHLLSRLSGDSGSSEADVTDESDPVADVVEGGVEESDPGDSGTEDLDLEQDTDGTGLDIRDSSLRRIANRLGHPSWVRKRSEDIRDLAKPATIIDGQHRVLGASVLGEAIPFSVVIMMESEWAEQVFQFTILNSTARPLAGQFVAGNASISLTESELDGLRERLKASGIKIKDVDVFAVVGGDSRSPFYDMVSVGERSATGKLGYGTMIRLGSAWYDAKPQFLQDLLELLYPDDNRRTRLKKWQDGKWADYFWGFWERIRDGLRTDEPDVWTPGPSRLMITGVLLLLQDEFFDVFAQQLDFWGDEVSDHETALARLRSRTETVISWIPADLFLAEWAVSGIQGSKSDRDVVAKTFRELIRRRGNFVWRNSSLVRGR